MRAVGVEELHHLPFVRHQLDPDRVEGAWLDGDAAAVLVRRPMVDGPIRTLSGFGPATGLHRLLDAVAAEVEPPARVMVDAPDATAVPAAWPLTEVRHWHWMRSTRALPPETVAVEEVDGPDEVDALLDAAAPDSHARPGTPGVEAWLGVRDDGGDAGRGRRGGPAARRHRSPARGDRAPSTRGAAGWGASSARR